MPAYVRWRRGLAYEKKHLLSRRELGRRVEDELAEAVYNDVPAPERQLLALAHTMLSRGLVTEGDLAAMGRVERVLARLWSAVNRVPVVGRLLLGVFPVLQVVATRRQDRARA